MIFAAEGFLGPLLSFMSLLGQVSSSVSLLSHDHDERFGVAWKTSFKLKHSWLLVPLLQLLLLLLPTSKQTRCSSEPTYPAFGDLKCRKKCTKYTSSYIVQNPAAARWDRSRCLFVVLTLGWHLYNTHITPLFGVHFMGPRTCCLDSNSS
jgi:hypothetical protein